MEEKFPWIPFYMELAKAISRRELVVGTGIWVYPSTCPYGYR